MTWRLKLLLLLAVAVPAFTGYPVNQAAAVVVPGARTAWIIYAMAVHLVVGALVGARAYAIMLSIAAAVTLPVVMAGGLVSFVLVLLSGGGWPDVFAYSPHYITLCLTLLTVVPMSLAMVAVIPFGRFERRLLSRAAGVSRREKALLIAIRAFNHVAFSVIPGVLEVIREERLLTADGSLRRAGGRGPARRMIRSMIHVGVDAICSSVQYLPLWAVEIAQLPTATPGAEAPQDTDRTADRKKEKR